MELNSLYDEIPRMGYKELEETKKHLETSLNTYLANLRDEDDLPKVYRKLLGRVSKRLKELKIKEQTNDRRR